MLEDAAVHRQEVMSTSCGAGSSLATALDAGDPEGRAPALPQPVKLDSDGAESKPRLPRPGQPDPEVMFPSTGQHAELKAGSGAASAAASSLKDRHYEELDMDVFAALAALADHAELEVTFLCS